MSMRRGARLAAVAFFATWIPLSLWRGLALGRTFRIGHRDSDAWGPLADAVINVAAIMLAPALLVALVVFVAWAWREERRAARMLLVCSAGALSCAAPEATPADDAGTPPVADHHLHLVGPDLLRDWKSLGVPFSRPDSGYLSVSAAQREGGSMRAIVVSMAHLYGATEFREAVGLGPQDEQDRAARTNDHVAAEVARDTAQLLGVCAVHPLRPYAERELARCLQRPGMIGLKLHVPSSELDLANDAHVAALARLTQRADSAPRLLFVHLGGGRTDSVRAERFFTELVSRTTARAVILAHGGGGGGYGPDSRHGLRAAIRYNAANPTDDRIHVELSALALPSETDGVPATTPEDAQSLVDDLRRFGLERVLYGSDYPAFSAADAPGNLRRLLPFTPAEWAQLFANRLPSLLLPSTALPAPAVPTPRG